MEMSRTYVGSPDGLIDCNTCYMIVVPWFEFALGPATCHTDLFFFF